MMCKDLNEQYIQNLLTGKNTFVEIQTKIVCVGDENDSFYFKYTEIFVEIGIFN